MNFADKIAKTVGSWKFILWQSAFLFVYVLWNINASDSLKFDPYPFVFLNLILSFQAAYTAPILLISHNKMAEHDRRRSELDSESTQAILKSIKKLERKLIDKIEDLEEEVKDD